MDGNERSLWSVCNRDWGSKAGGGHGPALGTELVPAFFLCLLPMNTEHDLNKPFSSALQTRDRQLLGA